MADRSEKRVVGVYSDEAAAQEAARAAEESGGRDVQVGAREDEVASLMGEMREETEHAWVGPTVGPVTKEMARSVPAWTLGGAAAGAVFTMAVNGILGSGLEIGGRLIIAAFVGAVFGGTIGFLVGGGFFEPRRKASSNLAAEEGVVVGATEPAEFDARHDPVRVDTIDAEGPEATVTTEDRQTEDRQRTTGNRQR